MKLRISTLYLLCSRLRAKGGGLHERSYLCVVIQLTFDITSIIHHKQVRSRSSSSAVQTASLTSLSTKKASRHVEHLQPIKSLNFLGISM